jgi:hypothetical protein
MKMTRVAGTRPIIHEKLTNAIYLKPAGKGPLPHAASGFTDLKMILIILVMACVISGAEDSALGPVKEGDLIEDS